MGYTEGLLCMLVIICFHGNTEAVKNYTQVSDDLCKCLLLKELPERTHLSFIKNYFLGWHTCHKKPLPLHGINRFFPLNKIEIKFK